MPDPTPRADVGEDYTVWVREDGSQVPFVNSENKPGQTHIRAVPKSRLTASEAEVERLREELQDAKALIGPTVEERDYYAAKFVDKDLLRAHARREHVGNQQSACRACQRFSTND